MEITSATSSGGPATINGNGFAELSSEEFIKVLFEELKNQDPLDPQDSNALLEQLSSLRNIESQLNLQTAMESLVLQNQFASAGGLIGKLVSGLDEANNEISGLVSSIRLKGDDVMLQLDTGREVPMKRVTGIANPPAPSSAV